MRPAPGARAAPAAAVAAEGLTEFMQNVFKYALQREYGAEEFEHHSERISSGDAIAGPDPKRKAPPQAFHASAAEREQIRNQAAPRRIIPAPDLLPAVEEEAV